MAFASLRKKLAQGLSRTRESISTGFQSMLGRKKIDEESLEDLEAAMLSADIGPLLTEQVLDEVRTRARKESVDGEGLRSIIKDVLMNGLPDVPEPAGPPSRPRVCFVVGINGGGKTTSVGKLAARHRAAGRKVMVVAADTFRTAAIEQLETWATRADVDLVKRDHGADPSSVVFDALEAAKARGNDLVLVDTAGRLHTKSNLMNELGKLARVAARVIPDAPHDVLLVVDATTGQNGLTQAKEFSRAAALTGVVLTKLDGTAKGGVALSIHRELGVPIRYVGVGEQGDDLREFERPGFVDSLLG